MGKIIIGIIMILCGFMLVWKNEAIVKFTGLSSWAENKIGTLGGTRMLYKLIGLAIIFGGLLVVTNLHQGFLEGTIGKLLRPSI